MAIEAKGPEFTQMVVGVPGGHVPYCEIVFICANGGRDDYLVTIKHEPKRDTTFDDHPLEI